MYILVNNIIEGKPTVQWVESGNIFYQGLRGHVKTSWQSGSVNFSSVYTRELPVKTTRRLEKQRRNKTEKFKLTL